MNQIMSTFTNNTGELIAERVPDKFDLLVSFLKQDSFHSKLDTQALPIINSGYCKESVHAFVCQAGDLMKPKDSKFLETFI